MTINTEIDMDLLDKKLLIGSKNIKMMILICAQVKSSMYITSKKAK